MTANHQTILAELYEIDPTLRDHEAELVPLIQKLLERDPAQKPSAAFVKKLRKELAARASHGDRAVEYRASYAAPSALSAFFQRFAFAAAGAVAAVVIAVPVTLRYAGDGGFLLPTDEDGARLATESANQADAYVTGAPSPDGKVAAPPTGTAYGRGQGGGGGDAMMGNPMMSLVAPWNPLKYRLEGELPALPTGDVTVLQRRPGQNSVAFSRIANAFEGIDLSSFDGTTVDTLTVAQRRPFGYMINISVADGSVSINQMWDQWPHPENECRDEACYQRLRPTLSDLPSDAEAIDIASGFLAEHDISTEGYGTPVVDDAWRASYEATEDKRYAWVPESVRVIFPLIVDGQPVIEMGGEPAGISVQVSVRHKRVSDAWGFTAYQFDREQQDAVTERADIEKFLSHAGAQYTDAPTATLRDPTLGYVRVYAYENGANRDLFVPALLFRVTDVPEGTTYHPRTVAVPLSKEMLDQATPPMPIDPMPMPRPMDGGPAVDVPAEEPFAEAQDKPLMIEQEEAAR